MQGSFRLQSIVEFRAHLRNESILPRDGSHGDSIKVVT